MKPRTVTLDTNCSIAIENKEQPSYTPLAEALEYHRRGEALVCVAGITPYEKRRVPTPMTAEQFEQWLSSVGLDGANVLYTPLYTDITIAKYGITMSDAGAALLNAISDVLYSTNVQTYAAANQSKFRNRLCDVLTIWSHIHAKNDMFVTNGRNFHKVTKRQRLIKLGAGAIVYPAELIQALRPTVS